MKRHHRDGVIDFTLEEAARLRHYGTRKPRKPNKGRFKRKGRKPTGTPPLPVKGKNGKVSKSKLWEANTLYVKGNDIPSKVVKV